MNKFLPNLLIVFALSLCGLCTVQWYREAHLRNRIETLDKIVFQKSESIQNLEAVIKRTEAEVLRLDKIKNDLTDIVKTNRQEILSLNRQVDKLENEIEAQKAQIDAYKSAVEVANENIQKQNETIQKQNEQLKTLADERNQNVEKYNKLVQEYNELVDQFKKLQEQAAKPAGKEK